VTEVGFYHLQRTGLERALPKLLEKVLERGLRAVVLVDSEERAESLNAALWTYEQRSFLPHGSARDGFTDEQPIYLTTADETPNGATVLVLVDGTDTTRLGDYDRCLDLFDGNDEAAVSAARARWTAANDAGHVVTYWQQDERGRWQQNA
jgi:DNA polymerase-3 subunit chi